MGNKIDNVLLTILGKVCGTAIMFTITLGTIGLALFFMKWILILLGVI